MTASENEAISFAERLRWPRGIVCHRCDGMDAARLPGCVGRYR
ncbi:transposase [Loktanella sp. DJP18]